MLSLNVSGRKPEYSRRKEYSGESLNIQGLKMLTRKREKHVLKLSIPRHQLNIFLVNYFMSCFVIYQLRKKVFSSVIFLLGKGR